MKVVGGEIVAAMLAAEGVDRVFGIVDGTYLGLYASFEKYGIRLISPRHETSAAHMAGAYARATGKLGVCMASNGPGVANVLPGVAVENGEGNRVLLVTSTRRQGIGYPDRGGTYQYFNQVGVTRPMSKWSGFASTVDRIPEMMRRALRISWRGRPGVVHVDVPENVLNGTYEIADGWQRPPASYRRVEPIAPPASQVAEVAERLREAERPMLHLGSGVIHAGAHEAVIALADRLQAPVTTSWGAASVLPGEHPLSVPTGALETAKEVRSQADLALVIGSRLGETDWWGRGHRWGGQGATVIQVDNDEEILGLNRLADQLVLADAQAFAKELDARLGEQPVARERLEARRAWIAEIGAQKKKLGEERDMALLSDTDPMHPAHVPHVARRVFGDDALAVIDGGNTAVWATMFLSAPRANSVFSTFKFGMLGAGAGQALGVKSAHPDRPVYCITGDGAMGMHVQEIETAVREELPVVFIVLCDRQWGMVKLTQQFGLGAVREVLGVRGEHTINADLNEIRFDDVARAMGAHGERVSAPSELEPTLRRALETGRTAVVHVDVDPAAHLFPPGLLEFKEMHQEPEG
ncbi:MAG: thiamine pyrophosphate-binding protein [Myxococcota bacterium]